MSPSVRYRKICALIDIVIALTGPCCNEIIASLRDQLKPVRSSERHVGYRARRVGDENPIGAARRRRQRVGFLRQLELRDVLRRPPVPRL